MEETEVMIIEREPAEWGSFIVRGIFALIIGIAVLLWTGITLEILMILFGALAIVYGIMTIIFALKQRVGETGTTVALLFGILTLILGIAAIAWPWVMAAALVTLIAAMMIVVGFSDIALAIFTVEGTANRLLLGLSGALSVIVGGVFIFFPVFGGIVLVALYLGVLMIAFGIISIAAGIAMRGAQSA
ncbi:HdeD family acid-resistance protein [Methanofollis fontis]|uniref:DUF308 domain-containing protein n=1 Tax=Methanofollis fontis TaxID=2052832 RepID=A0A483CZW3_9EURY|nr:DUF308 domain-containing protein [Methanofollis fontis]TAJ45749.1 hypothetical protein CUJ86_03290 [Methanofollis fontis]